MSIEYEFKVGAVDSEMRSGETKKVVTYVAALDAEHLERPLSPSQTLYHDAVRAAVPLAAQNSPSGVDTAQLAPPIFIQ